MPIAYEPHRREDLLEEFDARRTFKGQAMRTRVVDNLKYLRRYTCRGLRNKLALLLNNLCER